MKVRAINLFNRSFTLYPLSDVHWPRHEPDKLNAWRDAVLADPEAVVTLGGDMVDFARTTARAYLGAYQSDSNSLLPLDDMAYSQLEDLANFLKPVADRIVLTSVGNHAWIFKNGRVSDQELALKLGRAETWCGPLGIARLNLSGKTPVTIALHHDAGRKGGTASTDLLAFVHWSNATAADIYCAGHTHRQYAGVFSTRITIDAEEEKIRAKHLVFMRSGAFLKGYADSVPDATEPYVADYAEEKMLAPSVLGIISCRVEASLTGKLYFRTQQQTL